MNWKQSYHPYALITVIFWALAYVFSRLAMVHFSPYPLGLLRYVVATIFLAFVVVIGKIRPPKIQDFPWFIACGAAGFFLYMLTFNRGTQLVPAATSSVVIATAPVMTAFLARIFFGEKLAPYQWGAIGIEFCGIIVLTWEDGGFQLNEGILWLLGAALALSTYNLLQRKVTKQYDAVTISSYSIFCGTAMLLIFAPQAVEELQSAPPGQYINLLVLGIFASALAYLSWAKAFAKAKNTASVSNYMFVTPFFTAVFGFVFAQEVPDGKTLLGGLIILCGVVLFFHKNFVAHQQKG